tara:strand:+ start:13048 stop:13524 length:477 start_codon:yes stop_codon:yes gene_type:complete
MPNWCVNELSVEGDRKQISEFKEKAKGESSELSMNNFFPTPQEYLDKHKEEPRDMNWYQWRLNNWGCKWDVVAEIIHKTNHVAIYSFDSPWGPPVEFVQKVSSLFRKLIFRITFDEPGCDFAGDITCKKGEIVNEEAYPSRIASSWEDEEESEGRIQA